MKRLIYFFLALGIISIILSGCNKDNKDEMQGSWKADTENTRVDIGDRMKIDGNNIQVSNDGTKVEEDLLKYFNFKDKEQTKIRLYNEEKNSEDYDKNIPSIEGSISISDDKMVIKSNTNHKYVFVR